MKRNIKICILILFVIASIVFIYNNINIFIKHLPEMSEPLIINFPEDYKELFNSKKQRDIKHIYSEKINNKAYPISKVKIDNVDIFITKFTTFNNIKDSVIIKNNIQKTSRVWYEGHKLKHLKINIKRPIKPIKQILVLSNSIDTVLYGSKLTILKGNTHTIGISLIEPSKNQEKNKEIKLVNIFIEYDRPFSLSNENIKYYLALKKAEGIVYFIFIKVNKFDDQQILSYFK